MVILEGPKQVRRSSLAQGKYNCGTCRLVESLEDGYVRCKGLKEMLGQRGQCSFWKEAGE